MWKSLTKLRENAGVTKIASTWAFEKLHLNILINTEKNFFERDPYWR